MADIQQSLITKILNRNKNQPSKQAHKPYNRPSVTPSFKPYSPSDPDAGVWKHDLADRPSLSSRLSGGVGATGGQARGKELLPGGKAVGSRGNFAPVAGPSAPRNGNAGSRGVELLPAGGARGRRGQQQPQQRTILDPTARLLVRSGAGVATAPHTQVQPQSRQNAMFIMGAAKSTTVWVRISGLAGGTTADDVLAVFSPLPITSSVQVSSPDASLATVDLEFTTRAAAQEAVDKYHGAVADGNALSVKIMETRSRLIDRMNGTNPVPVPVRSESNEMEIDVAPVPVISSKLYSDSILQSDPRATVITLATDSPRSQRRRGGGGGQWGRS